MLTNFFKLNPAGPIVDIPDADALVRLFQNSKSLRNAAFARNVKISTQGFADLSFENVNLSRAQFSSVTFRNCNFKDCILIGVRFEECEFHDCEFVNCNTYKIQFRGVYVDPTAFVFEKTYRTTHANIGLYLYQQLFRNALDTHQNVFAAAADVEMRRWLRHQRSWELRTRHLSASARWSKATEVARNLFFDAVAKYGYGPMRFFVCSAISFAALGLVASHWWPMFGMVRLGSTVVIANYWQALYYCMLLSTTLGFSDVMPGTRFGQAFALGCAVLGIGWAGLFTAILVRRVIR